MLIKKESIPVLEAFSSSERISETEIQDKGWAFLVQELFLSGILDYIADESTYTLSYPGKELVEVLNSLKVAGVDLSKEKDGFKWLGSEIIALIHASLLNKDKTTPISNPVLERRGLAKNGKITDSAKRIYEIYSRLEPRLSIDAELADYIRRAPMGPTNSHYLPIEGNKKDLLEAMRLVSYSVPDGEFYAFSGLGQWVKKALSLAGWLEEGVVLDESIMLSLVKVVDGEEIDEDAVIQLEELGYLSSDGSLSPAGEMLLNAYRYYSEQIDPPLRSFAINEEEVQVLKAIDRIWREKYPKNKEELPTFEEIRRELVDRKVKEYKRLLDLYGRRLDEMPKKKRELLEKFRQAKDLMKWYEDNFQLRELLYSLESFGLIYEGEDEETGKAVFYISDIGQRVLSDQEDERSIHSWAVKTVTLANKMFSAPNREWVEEARKERVLGTYEPTSSGYLYEWIAHQPRSPYMTAYEAKVFKLIPDRGMTVEELLKEVPKEEREVFLEALDGLEAKGFIEILSDGHIVETEYGEMMDRAMSGVPDSFGAPINPLIYRVVKAIAETGNLYVKEKKIRMLPRNIKEAMKKSGLTPERFEEALLLARKAKYIGRSSVNEAGMLLLEAVERMNQGGEV